MTQNDNSNFDILVVGGGSAGITVAARLAKQVPEKKIGVIEPSHEHYYQPLFTLVGAGIIKKERTMKTTAQIMPKGVEWIIDACATFLPDENLVITASGERLSYKYLIVAPGIQIDWHKIKGLTGNIGKGGVCCNYSVEHVQETWRIIKDFKGGVALFTFPNTPVKCAGAPQKIMYLAEEYFRKRNIREHCQIKFVSAAAAIFGVKKYAQALTNIIEHRDIETTFRHNLVEIDVENRIALFEDLATKEKRHVPYDMIHVTPPMSAPDFVKKSPLANSDGWVDVDMHSLQHKTYRNVFALGDASSLPTSRTGAAIRKQAPILVKNLLSLMRGEELREKYDGYTSCPLVTGYGKLILAEFDYDGNPKETFPFDQSKERLSMYLLKKHVLPKLYWQGMLKGRA